MSETWNPRRPEPRTCARHNPGDSGCDDRCAERLVLPAPSSAAREVGPEDERDMETARDDLGADQDDEDELADELQDLGDLPE